MRDAAVTLVTLSGPPGSGTTTVARILATRLGFKYVNTGAIFRDMAGERGIPLNDFGKLAGTDPTIDQELDRRQVEIARQGGVVLEGRLAGFMTWRAQLKGVRVRLDAPLAVRVRRVSQRDGTPAEAGMSLTVERERDERNRYLRIYGFDLESTEPYDLVLDSGRLTPAEIVGEILAELKRKGEMP